MLQSFIERQIIQFCTVVLFRKLQVIHAIFLGNSLQLLIIFAAVLNLNRILIAYEYVTGARRGVSQKKMSETGSVTEERDRNRIKRQKYRSEAGSGPEEKE